MVKYKYVPKGCNIALRIIDKEMNKGLLSKFYVYYDPDIDGLMAGYITERYIDKFNKPSLFYINENREHGFKMSPEDYKSMKGGTLIAVDFSMNRDEVKMLLAEGVNVVSIDHHTIDDDFVHEINEETGCEGVIINNQYSWEPAEYRFLSGAGVVYYVFRYIDDKLGFSTDMRDEEALVGITLLSDVRETEGLIAQEFLKETYKNESPTMKYLVDLTTEETGYAKYDSFGVPCMNRNFIDYNFSPLFNALFRLNKGHDAILLVKGNPTKRAEYKSGNEIFTCRRIQNNITAIIVDNLTGVELSSLVVKGVKHDLPVNSNYRLSNFIGLACSRVRGDLKTTFLYVESDIEGEIQRGSVRGLYDNVDYLNIFRAAGFKAEGHKNAFGILKTNLKDIDIEGLNSTIEYAERVAKEKSKETRKIMETPNLTLFLKGPNKNIAYINTMVRDAFRVYLKYKGNNVVANKRGKMIEYIVDGVPVKCFDLDLNMENGVILPIYGRGDYIEFTLRRDIS